MTLIFFKFSETYGFSDGSEYISLSVGVLRICICERR